jgi:hypothetical protein
MYAYALFLISVFHTSCGQNQTCAPPDTGVLRYDGKSFTNITSAISSPSFWDVLEDRKGNLWFGTRDSGVYCYPWAPLRAGGKSFQHFTTKDGIDSNSALHIYEDKAGNIWFATGGG